MREERGQINGDVVVYEEFTLWGSIGGDVKVLDGGKFYMRGALYGDLTVEYGGRVHIFGNVSGTLTLQRGTKVVVSGNVGGDVINDGGRLYVDKSATILGKLKTLRGETKVESKVDWEG